MMKLVIGQLTPMEKKAIGDLYKSQEVTIDASEGEKKTVSRPIIKVARRGQAGAIAEMQKGEAGSKPRQLPD